MMKGQSNIILCLATLLMVAGVSTQETQGFAPLQVDPAGVVLGQDDLLKRSSDKSNGTGLPCRTFDYEQGICLKKEQCYPFTKLHNTPELDTWLGGTKGTCFYSDPSGEQVRGICCRTIQSRTNSRLSLLPESDAEDIRGLSSSRLPSSGKPVARPAEADFPYMAAIVNNGTVACAGTLIDGYHVLTSARCIHQYDAKGLAHLAVILGTSNLSQVNDRVVRYITSYTHLKSFDASQLSYDIAILTLDSIVEFDSNVSPISLCRDSKKPEGDSIVVAWGNSRYEPKGNTLHSVKLLIKTENECQRTRLPDRTRVVNNFLCAGSDFGDACIGDDGGPLLVDNCQAGIISLSNNCQEDNYRTFLHIAPFIDWIDKNTQLQPLTTPKVVETSSPDTPPPKVVETTSPHTTPPWWRPLWPWGPKLHQ